MSDISTGKFQRNIAKIILEALKVWEEYDLRDESLWEIFQKFLKGFTKEDFRSTANFNI